MKCEACQRVADVRVRHNSPTAPWEANLCRQCVPTQGLFTFGPVQRDARELAECASLDEWAKGYA